MHKLELLLRKYTDNFLLLDEITNNQKIEYLNFNKIVTVTDSNLIKVASINTLINILKENFNSKLIVLSPGEPNYEMIESTSQRINNGQYDLVIALGGGSILDIVKAASMYDNAIETVDNLLIIVLRSG